jgi:hypothetical protein
VHRRLSVIVLALALVLAACGRSSEVGVATAPADQPEASAAADAPGEDDGVTIVVAPAVQGKVDEALVLDAYRRAVAQGERDFGTRPERPVTVYVDPDSAIGLEDALGLSARNAIHLRAGRAQRMDTLLPLMMHEYMHVLQYNAHRLRPQWWIEGQADHQAQRVVDPGRAASMRRSLYSSLASDVRNNRAPSLASLRGSTGWDEYVKRSGAGKAYGWGHAAVAYIEDGWGFDAVARLVRDTEGPNTLGSFDEAIRRETGLGPAEFEAGLRTWLLKQA